MTHLTIKYPEVAIARSAKGSGVLEGGSWLESHRRLLELDYFSLKGMATSIFIIETFKCYFG